MLGNKAAIGQHYNAASDRYISHDGVVHALAKAAGVEANIVHYDTKAVSLAKVWASQALTISLLLQASGAAEPLSTPALSQSCRLRWLQGCVCPPCSS